ncbi:MAG TPA: hypothetical protein DEA08_02445 [Planctomycetes bacterium]|nr:hypothetical protein [Planctomycetota bacterium]
MRHHLLCLALLACAAPLAAQDAPQPEGKQDLPRKDAPEPEDPKETYDFAVDFEGSLYRVDCEKLEFKRVGRIEVPAAKEGAQPERPVLCDLAATADGHLYGISTEAVYHVNLVDPSKSRRVGKHGLEDPYGMCAVGNVLLANTRVGAVHLIDRDTAKPTQVGPMGSGWAASGDVTWFEGGLISSVKDPARVEHLVWLEPRTGKAKLVGKLRRAWGTGGPVGAVFGLIERKGVLYGLTSTGDVLQIDPKTARCKLLKRTRIRWWGATSYTRF